VKHLRCGEIFNDNFSMNLVLWKDFENLSAFGKLVAWFSFVIWFLSVHVCVVCSYRNCCFNASYMIRQSDPRMKMTHLMGIFTAYYVILKRWDCNEIFDKRITTSVVKRLHGLYCLPDVVEWKHERSDEGSEEQVSLKRLLQEASSTWLPACAYQSWNWNSWEVISWEWT